MPEKNSVPLRRPEGSLPKISVVVPVYNSERYLDECVHSVLDQRYPSLEIILVDDGSADSSGAMCDAFEADNPGVVRVVHKNNAGVSAARNTGMSLATGEYIMFVDSDDVLPFGSIRLLLNSAAAYRSDMVYGEYAIMLNGKVGEPIGELGSLPEGKVPFTVVLASLASMAPKSITGSCWRALFKASFIKCSAAMFPEGIAISEDYDFILQCLAAEPSISVVHDVVYWVRRGSVSVTQSYLASVGHDMGVVNMHLKTMCEGSSELMGLYYASAANSAWSECSNAYKKDSPLSCGERWRLVKDALSRGDEAIRGARSSSDLPLVKLALLNLGRICPLALFLIMEARSRHS